MPYSVVTAVWNGFPGAPGYTRLKWNGVLTPDDLALAAGKMHDFFDSIKTWLPPGASITFDGQGLIYDDSAVLTDAASYTPPANVVSVGQTAFAGPAGAYVRWITNQYANGRRITGKSFLVPLAIAAFDGTGTLSSAFLTAARAAATQLVTSDPLLAIRSGEVGQPGIVAVAQSALVPDKAAVLRSRRD